jgi:hypothetical protein
LAKKPGYPEPATRDSYWIGCEIEWKSSDDDEVIKTTADQLIGICRRAFAADVDKTETATYGKGKSEIPMLSKSESGESWMDQRMEELFDARIGLRMAFTTAAFIKGSLELFMLSDSPATGAPSTSLGRIKTGGGNGELWMNWFEGMDTSLNITNSLVVDAGTWGKLEKVPDAIRKDSLLRIKEENIDQDLFNSWIDGIIAASKSSRIPAWPSFAIDDILAQVNSTEPRLASLLKMLEAGPRSVADLRDEAGDDGKKLLLTINRLTSWTKRYNKPSPLVPSNDQADAIEINPAYCDLLLTRLS